MQNRKKSYRDEKIEFSGGWTSYDEIEIGERTPGKRWDSKLGDSLPEEWLFIGLVQSFARGHLYDHSAQNFHEWLREALIKHLSKRDGFDEVRKIVLYLTYYYFGIRYKRFEPVFDQTSSKLYNRWLNEQGLPIDIPSKYTKNSKQVPINYQEEIICRLKRAPSINYYSVGPYPWMLVGDIYDTYLEAMKDGGERPFLHLGPIVDQEGSLLVNPTSRYFKEYESRLYEAWVTTGEHEFQKLLERIHSAKMKISTARIRVSERQNLINSYLLGHSLEKNIESFITGIIKFFAEGIDPSCRQKLPCDRENLQPYLLVKFLISIDNHLILDETLIEIISDSEYYPPKYSEESPDITDYEMGYRPERRKITLDPDLLDKLRTRLK
jgi:hypothetical protein